MTKIPEDANREFTASSFIVEDNKVLLIFHNDLEVWVQPGGRIEDNETPDETALRKAEEEVNVKISFSEKYLPDFQSSNSEDCPEPFHVNAHRISEDHWHCDFCFLAELKEDAENYNSDEHSEAKWFSREELKNQEYDIPDNIRKTCLKAIKLSNRG